MSKNIKKRVIDVTGVELTPGEPAVCLGNGEQGFECCCDECDYYLFCFPEFDPFKKEVDTADNKVYIESSHKKDNERKKSSLSFFYR